MDILVTMPRGHTTQETGLTKTWWKMGRRPKSLVSGDRVYFIEYGEITFYEKFTGKLARDPVDYSGRVLVGEHLVLDSKDRRLRGSIRHKGFQGFRYIKPDSALFRKLRAAE